MQNAVNWKPEKTGFMDGAMQRLWDQFGKVPGDLRLYGGTALALYLGHRHSTDFDFAAPPGAVTRSLVEGIPALRGGSVRGNEGLFDVVVPGERQVMVTFMEWGHLIPEPVEEPMMAANGVRVAHPVDLVAAKVQACVSRETTRDYADIAAAVGVWSRWTLSGVRAAIDHGEYDAPRIARVLADPPLAAAHALDTKSLARLRRFARDLPDRLVPRGPER